MKSIILGMVLLLGVAVPTGQALAWASANRFGGSTEHVPGATEHTNAYGGSSAHVEGVGSEHTNMDGGRTATSYGYGTVHTAPDGASAYRPPEYAPYHPPVVVPHYASGCYNCANADAAGAVVGVGAGAAVVSTNRGPTFVVGTSYSSLPVNANPVRRNGVTYYSVGDAWFQPAYGANGVYYRVVPAP
ncbi:MAG: hypothetical protein JNM42_05720 [Propionivibrio sp.]|uniref:hypothetical protein n=1 Tax=Propionivibrio sp. TaxID=2212460 RepID=UPI001A4AB72A|nr:hypothetical protein [Propionivibrio sp.]MBL8413917.1 hypothetical protein [Propionivibrio sp.]